MRVAENQNTMRKHTHADIDSDGSESELEFHHTHIHNRIGTSHPLEGILTKLLSIVSKSSSPQVIFVLLKAPRFETYFGVLITERLTIVKYHAFNVYANNRVQRFFYSVLV